MIGRCGIFLGKLLLFFWFSIGVIIEIQGVSADMEVEALSSVAENRLCGRSCDLWDDIELVSESDEYVMIVFFAGDGLVEKEDESVTPV